MNFSPRTKFVLMFVLFALPMTVSYLMYFFWKPTATINFGVLITPAIMMPEENFSLLDGRDASAKAGEKALRGKWLIVTRDSGVCDAVCTKKLYTMRQTRLTLNRDLERVARVLLIDDLAIPSVNLMQAYAGTAFVSAKESAWLAMLPREQNDATGGRGYIYAIDPMGNLFMRYKADEVIKDIVADFQRVLKASQLGKEFEDK
ncbi:MAG: hypothetical protein WCL29_04360 [Pseudomonadota bacterium]